MVLDQRFDIGLWWAVYARQQAKPLHQQITLFATPKHDFAKHVRVDQCTRFRAQPAQHINLAVNMLHPYTGVDEHWFRDANPRQSGSGFPSSSRSFRK